MPRISLSDVVGRNSVGGNRLPDTLKLKLGLERLGYYEAGEQGFVPGPDDGLWYGLEAYQRERGLDVDGLALPDGPTVAALNEDLRTAPAPSLIRGNLDMPVSSEAVTSNRRTARALAGLKAVGDLPTFVVSALKSGTPEAPAELADLFAQSYRATPEQAGRLRLALEDYLGTDDLSRLDSKVRSQVGSEWDKTFAQLKPHGESTSGRSTDVVPSQAPSESDDLFGTLRENLRPREGGYANRPKSADPGGPTDQGISTKFLKSYNARHPEKGLPDDPAQLSDEQKTQLYREEFFDRPQIEKLAKVPGLVEAAPKLAEQIFDIGVLHGTERAGIWLQEALDEQLRTDLRTKKSNGSRDYDGIIGSGTRRAVEQAVREGKIGSVYDALVEKRLEFMRSRENFAKNPGWISRAESFRP